MYEYETLRSKRKWYIEHGQAIRRFLLRRLERLLRELRNPPAFSRGERISVRNSCYPKTERQMNGNHLSRIKNLLDLAQGFVILPFPF